MQYYFNALWAQKAFSPCLIAIVAIVGDRFVSSPQLNQLQRAIVDNFTHAVIGVVTWYCVIVWCSFQNELSHVFLESIICGILSSLIDVDHFIAAKSLHITQDAVRLESRPFLHCTSVLLGVCGALLLVGHVYSLVVLQQVCWIAAAAILSHHIRDATRRGLFMWPFGSTPPIPYVLYICLSMVLPLFMAALLSHSHHKKLHHVVVWEV